MKKDKLVSNALEKAKIAVFAISMIMLFVISGCTDATGPGTTVKPGDGADVSTNGVVLDLGTYEEGAVFDPGSEITTKSFSSDAEFAAFVKRFESQSYSMDGIASRDYDTNTNMVKIAAGVSDLAVESLESGGSAPQAVSSYSETNVQVAGIDEADLIKTDGSYIYTISGDSLYIIKAYPGEDAEIVSTIRYKDRVPLNIFIQDDHLAVFGELSDLDSMKNLGFTPRTGMTFFTIYDISDKADAKTVKEYLYEGSYFNARMKDDYVYFVVRNMPYYRNRWPTPVIVEGDKISSIPVSDMYYYDIPYSNPQFVTVHAIDLADPSAGFSSKSVAVEGSQNLYMSHENIFITYTERISEYDIQKEITKELLSDSLTEDDIELIAKIKATDNDVLSQYEKENKIYQIYSSYLNFMPNDEREELEDRVYELLEERLSEYDCFEYTVINRISVDKEDISIAGNSRVPGHIMNQFSLDEDTSTGVLRIATTISGRWSRFGKGTTESSNNVYALDSDMDVIGKLEGIAETEQIYSTRFIADRLYMVTYRQVDPFFVIDLSDPEQIRELGKLKIPGFSRYLHPYDSDTIIGIGQETTSSGRTKGLKISLFDVSDVENPEEIAKYVTEERYAQSNALYEHKAFLFDREKELLVIPVYSYEYRSEGSEGYNGAFVFRITKDEISLRGLVDHSSADSNWYGPKVERSLWIEDMLYTKSLSLLRINAISDLHSVKNITLVNKDTGFKVY
ncbi:beta-propeller domain-containing protein [Candidatus Woesearchaeota archaeon]|nr:beta-propeller domain-containing protein [Candidatus Woesearchaeota archaeon]